MSLYTFTDAKGRTWDLTLNLGAVRRVDRSDFSAITDRKFSLLNPDKDTLVAILTNTPLLFAVVFAVVKPQVPKVLGIDPDQDYEKAEEEFLSGIDGETISRVREVFWESLASFFPDQKTGLLLLKRQYQKGMELVNKELETMEGELTQVISHEFKQAMVNMKKELISNTIQES